MDVHVPQAGNQKFAGRIDHAGPRRGFDILSYRNDPPIGDDDRNVRARRRAGRIDNSSVFENKACRGSALSPCGREEGDENNQPEKQDEPLWLFFRLG
jgi:hypothetical protein